MVNISKIPVKRRIAPKVTIIFCLAFYILFSVCTVWASRSEMIVTLGENRLPLSAFTGVFSTLGNICLVVTVLYYKKPGFIISMAIIILQIPMIIFNMMAQHSIASIPGLVNDLFVAAMVVVIYINQVKVEKERKRMQDLFKQTAIALVGAIDTKDAYTHGHSARVAEYSRKLAELNNKSERECEEIYYTALLHDVGKIGVPISIINKAGKLTKEEYEVVKHHPVMGAQILEKISEFPFLSVGARYHHERYDGKGYPDGLKQDAIPEIARIISVADAYDAITSIRSYREPMSQDKAREEIVKGIGTQFDPHYARLMLHLIDLDSEYEMKERTVHSENEGKSEIVIDEYRSGVSDGILVTEFMTTVSVKISSEDKDAELSSAPSMILFDSLDGFVHSGEKAVQDMLYFEYGEIWFDGRTITGGARKIHTRVENSGCDDLMAKDEYRIDMVRIKDHALIRISGKSRTVESIIALPDSTRYLYIGFTGAHCRINNLITSKAETESPSYTIPRIAEEISYIKGAPEGDVPNVQVDGFRSAHSAGIRIKDGLKISFHAKSLPTARLVWHCPFIDIFCGDDAKVYGKNYRELVVMRFDGECWEDETGSLIEMDNSETASFEGWDKWMEFNHNGFDATVSFEVRNRMITVITENGGIRIRCTVKKNGIDRALYAAVTGDQVAITDIRLG